MTQLTEDTLRKVLKIELREQSKTQLIEYKKIFATKENLLALKNYVDQRFDELKEKMFTKQDYMDHLAYLDRMIVESNEAAIDREVFADRCTRLDDKVADHENRLKCIEG